MIVMKFGGTSVGTPEAIRQTADIIATHRAKDHVVVVVSALSGVTDRLIAAAVDARERRRDPDTILQDLYEHHRACCQGLGLGDQAADLLEPLSQLGEVLRGVHYLRELTPRSKDFVVSHGELLSSRIVAACLNQRDLEARAVPAWDAGVLTDDNHGAAALDEESWARIPERLSDLDTVPVVTGFLGETRSGDRSTLGRGGSDYSAAIFGRALGASEIQIWTDVSGIYSTDPRIVREAHPLPEVTFEEAAELAYFGAKVIHPKTIEPAVAAGIPVRVLNTFAPGDEGTRIVPGRRETRRDLVAIAVKRRNTILTLDSTRMLAAEGYLATVFDELKAQRISVDAIATSEVSVCMTVEERYAEALERASKSLGRIAHVDLRPGRAIICAVGAGMRERPGTAARIFAATHAAGVNIEMISMGSSKINLTFVVRDEDADRTIQALHTQLL